MGCFEQPSTLNIIPRLDSKQTILLHGQYMNMNWVEIMLFTVNINQPDSKPLNCCQTVV